MSVYFIKVGGYFKVGYSDDPSRRFDRLHTSGTRYTFPADASIRLEDRELYKVIAGSKSDEHAIHLALDSFSVGLEWFLDEPPLRAFIDALPDGLSARQRDRLAKVPREGGWCEAEYDRVQHGRAQREVTRYLKRRAS